METVGKEIAGALVNAQKEFKNALKDSVNPHFKSNYADLSNVIESVRPYLNRSGITVLQPIKTSQEGYFLSTLLIHSSGESINFGEMKVALSDADLKNAQKVGAAITYARRYHLASVLCVALEDDDANDISIQKNNRPINQTQNRPVIPQGKTLETFKNEQNLIAEITTLCGVLTMNQTVEEKVKFINNKLGVANFKDLKNKNEAQLSALLQNLKGDKQ